MVTAIILAAGEGLRAEAGGNKVLLEVLGKPIFCHTLDQFEKNKKIDRIVVVVNADEKKKVEECIKKFKYKKVKKVVPGGKTRQGSVYKGFSAFINFKNIDIILIHNAANPLVTDKEIEKTIEMARKCGAAVVGTQVKDTVKLVKGNQIKRTLDREEIYTVQTPQVIKYGLMKKAFERAQKTNFEGTDDSTLVERIGVKVHIIKASKTNFKITTPMDIEIFRNLMGEMPQEFRGGIGEDSHSYTRSKKEKGLYLGGVYFEELPKVEANSDGDIAIHALCNAISSAIGEESLGTFADKMCKEKGITDSKEYLKVVLGKMDKQKYRLRSVSLSFECSNPEIDPIAGKMKNSLAKLLSLEKPQIGITATSGDKLSEAGKGKGIKCTAMVNLVKR